MMWALVAVAAAADLDVYTRSGCPRCEDAREFLVELSAERPDLDIAVHPVDTDPEARAELERACREAGVQVPGVPAFVIGDALVVGYRDEATTGQRIRDLLDGRSAGAGAAGEVCEVDAPDCGADVIETRVGRLAVSDLGLPLFTIAIGLLDGFNPCAMWVLLLLLSLLAGMKDRRRMALIAGTFVAASGLVYYAFLAAWLNVFLLIGLSRPAQVVLGLASLVVGGFHVKDFFALGQGPSLSIPASAKPGLLDRMRAVARAERLGGAMVGVAVLAVLVNLVELLCTAGLPAVYTAILSRQGLSGAEWYAYLALYDLAYVVDDALIVAAAVFTFSRRRLQEGEGRWLKLAGGLVLVGLALAMLFFPSALTFQG